MKRSVFFLVFLLISSNSYSKTAFFSILNIELGSNIRNTGLGLFSESLKIRVGVGCPYRDILGKHPGLIANTKIFTILPGQFKPILPAYFSYYLYNNNGTIRDDSFIVDLEEIDKNDCLNHYQLLLIESTAAKNTIIGSIPFDEIYDELLHSKDNNLNIPYYINKTITGQIKNNNNETDTPYDIIANLEIFITH